MAEIVDERLLPELLAKIKGLELRARTVVEGFLGGMHRSTYKGSSIEFAEHRPYFPGDDVRHVDWKAYAKSDRLYVREFEEETNLRCYLFVDASASMSFGTTAMGKFEYASVTASALAYLALKQRDSVGLVLFNERTLVYIPPRMHPSHFETLVEALESVRPYGRTNFGSAILELGERLKRRGLIILLSDLIEDDGSFQRALSFLRHRKHEIITFQVLDPAELELPFDEPSVFRDMESHRALPADPVALSASYRRELEKFLTECKEMCSKVHADYKLLRTDEPFDKSLSEYLSWRSRRRRAITSQPLIGLQQE
ncbi:MAG: DUF58 domain-containing protein [Armatimonadota bacterium]|nr:DUF58 domain-containing protein [Armatimonadota bacterium]MCX7777651.1 DUF58 domain-containing protein [Armatimonadota bacterium]MDW8025897.1 DUF58 domain-containing protein [Armatimonadota bacterium]